MKLETDWQKLIREKLPRLKFSFLRHLSAQKLKYFIIPPRATFYFHSGSNLVTRPFLVLAFCRLQYVSKITLPAKTLPVNEFTVFVMLYYKHFIFYVLSFHHVHQTDVTAFVHNNMCPTFALVKLQNIVKFYC